MESVLMDPTITATVIGVLLTVVCGGFAFAVRWLRSDIHNLRTEVNDRFTAVEKRITTEVGTLETKIGTLETKLETKIDALGSKLDGLIMALANSGSLTYLPETTPLTATQPPSTETTLPQSSISETAGQAICDT